MHRAEITVTKSAGVNYLKVIGSKREYKRSSVSMSETKTEITVRIKAEDPTALKASINSVLNDIEIVEKAGGI
ncbi:MAG: hypothetical protein KGH98_03405 [Candidatus Micrarchaeota archaeon]|nr:hypothetical protein [Candidatus Micrarchaeota archaeon]